MYLLRIFSVLVVISMMTSLCLPRTVLAKEEAISPSVVILMYHRFGEDKYPSTNIRISQFLQQLDYLKQNKFHVWPLSKIIEQLRQGKAFPDRTVAITIDDAYLSVYQKAYPLLKQRGWPFTVFVSTDHVDKNYSNYMRWDHLREMMKHGLEIGNHSSSHDHLIRHNEDLDVWKVKVLNDIETAAKRINQELGVTPEAFAYPYGEYSLELSKLVTEMGLIGFGQHSGAVGMTSDTAYLPRYPMSEIYGEFEQFKTKLWSLALPVHKVQPQESVWKDETAAPVLSFEVPGLDVSQLNCFASGRGKIQVNISGQQVTTSSDRGFATRRFRYNCTLPSTHAGRFYWYSHPWINPALPEQ